MDKKNLTRLVLSLIFLMTTGLMFATFYHGEIRLSYFLINTLVDTLLIAYLKAMRKSKVKVLTSLLYVFCLVVLLVDVFYYPIYNVYVDVSKANVLNGWSTLSIIFEAIKDYTKTRRFLVIAGCMIVNIVLFFIPSFESIIAESNEYFKEKQSIITGRIIRVIWLLILVFAFVFVVKVNDIYRSIYESTAEVVYVKYLYKTMENEDETNEVYVPKINKYTGLARGRNVYIIQCEALQNFVIGREYNGKVITPNINKIIEGSTIYFDNCHSQISNGNTSDAEFILNTGFYPIYKSSIYLNSDGVTFKNTLPEVMKRNGYTTSAFHGYKDDMWNRQVAWKAIGYENISLESSYDVDEVVGLGLSDKSFFHQSIEKIKNIQQDGKKSFNVLITLSSHTPFDIGDEYGDVDIKDEDKDTTFGNYINSISYLDECIGGFIEELKENDMYDNSVIVIYGDHHAITPWDSAATKVEELTGFHYGYPEYSNVPFIVNIPGEKYNITCRKLCGQIDIMPTLLNLLGIENLDEMSGEDVLLNADESGFLEGINYTIAGCFVSDKYVFMKDRLLSKKNAYLYDRINEKQLWYEDLDVNVKAEIDELSEKAMKKYFKDNVYYNRNNIIINK